MKKGRGRLLITFFLAKVSSAGAMEDKELSSTSLRQFQQNYAEEMYNIGKQCLSTALNLLNEDSSESHTIVELIQIQTNLAVDCLQKASDSGHELAPYDLAIIYHGNAYDLPIEVDLPKAINLYKQAEAKEHYGAVVELTYIYQHGNGVPQNYQESLTRLLKLIEMGDTMALSEVGKYYFKGLGVLPDYKKAAEYYYRAVLKDVSEAVPDLAKMYEEGVGVAQDASKAAQWNRLYVQGN